VSDYDPVERSTDLDSHGLAPAVEPDRCAQSGGHGMEEVTGRISKASPTLTESTAPLGLRVYGGHERRRGPARNACQEAKRWLSWVLSC
jgi:hypothetical protein